MNKRRRYAALGIGLSVLMTAGGSSSVLAKENNDKQVVTFYSWADGAEQDAEKALIAKYEELHPDIDIEENYVPYSEYLSKINTLAAADDMPDVYKLPEANGIEWGTKGMLLDLAPVLEEKDVDIYDTTLSNSIFAENGHIWGVGNNIATMVLYYNKEIFDEAGIAYPSSDADKPWTWDEYVETAKKLTKDSKGKTAEDAEFNSENTVVYGTMMPTGWTSFVPLLYTNDAAVANEDGTKLLINSPEGIDVIQSIADLSLVEKCAPSNAMAKGAFADTSTMLMNGQVAMVIEGSWALSNYTNEGFDVGVAPLPAFAHEADMSWSGCIGMSPKDADNDAALEFFLYYTDFSNSITVANESNIGLGGLPHSKSVYENIDEWAATYSSVDEKENLQIFTDILNQKNTRLGENVSLKNFGKIMDNIIVPALDRVWVGDATAEEALSSLDVESELEGVWN